MTPVRREGYKFLQDICVPCYFTDASFSLKPSSFMDICQEIAYWAASELGFGYDDLNVHHTAWVLSRMHFHISKYPKWRDNVTIYTWHKGAEGLFYLRDFQLKDAEGEIIASSTSSWLIIDTRTRHIVREGEVFSTLNGSRVNDNAIEEQAPKVVLPKGIEPELVKEHTVSYSDIDIIGHIIDRDDNGQLRSHGSCLLWRICRRALLRRFIPSRSQAVTGMPKQEAKRADNRYMPLSLSAKMFWAFCR